VRDRRKLRAWHPSPPRRARRREEIRRIAASLRSVFSRRRCGRIGAERPYEEGPRSLAGLRKYVGTRQLLSAERDIEGSSAKADYISLEYRRYSTYVSAKRRSHVAMMTNNVSDWCSV